MVADGLPSIQTENVVDVRVFGQLDVAITNSAKYQARET